MTAPSEIAGSARSAASQTHGGSSTTGAATGPTIARLYAPGSVPLGWTGRRAWVLLFTPKADMTVPDRVMRKPGGPVLVPFLTRMEAMEYARRHGYLCLTTRIPPRRHAMRGLRRRR